MKKAWILFFALAMLFIISSASADLYATEYGVKFGMTPQEVQDIEKENNHELKDDYEDENSYQLYYEKDIHFYSLKCTRMEYDFDVEKRLLFQVYYVSSGGAADFAYFQSLLTMQHGSPVNDTNDSGEYSLLYERIGRDSHIGVSHWLVPDQNLGIDLWHNDYGTVFATFYDTSNPASYGALPKYYTDETGISFAYIDGWDALTFSINPIMIIFTNRRDTQTSIQYMQLDIWETLKEYYEPLGFKREDIGPDFMEDDILRSMMQPIKIQNIRTKRYGSLDFKVFEYQTDNDGASPEMYNCTTAVMMQNGYAHMFQLSSTSGIDENMPILETLLSTVTFGGSPEASSSNGWLSNTSKSEKTSIDLGSTVTFGQYEQDNNTVNGKEPIEWVVIGVEDDYINLITKDIIDLQRYNIQKEDITWATCNLRNWLNNEFFNASFTLDEQRAMKRWSYKDIDGTQLNDYVYCLSASEVESIWPNQQDRAALVTDYVYALSDYTNSTKAGQWWLRSESVYNGIFRTAQDVYASGSIGVDNFRSATVGVRPCICVAASAVNGDASGTSDTLSTNIVNKVTLSADNIEQYFDIKLTGKSFEGNKLTVAFDIAPQKETYWQAESSSNEIVIRLVVYAYDDEKSTNVIAQKNYTNILKKKNNYSTSGKIEIILPTSTLETVYWNYDIDKCTGTIAGM